MEFKVFKSENDKILKEYWLTPSEWDALDKTTVQEGDIYHIVGTIDKGDLSADVNASLAKADSSLQKPTTTLAKESFVKVGIDGTQKFDESSYVIAPSTDGTAGQVLKKTANGTEWANETGGGGGKLYMHSIYSGATGELEQISIYLINSSVTPLTIETISADNIKGFVNGSLYHDRDMTIFPITNIEVKNGKLEVCYIGTNFSENYKTFTLTPFGSTPFDTVTEL